MKSTVKIFMAASCFTAYTLFTSFISQDQSADATTDCGTYDVQLVSNGPSGVNYEWVWSVTNPNPGNGTNCTLQNLSHWSIVLPDCIDESNIVEAAYSTDGVGWVTLPSTIAVDPSQDCFMEPVLKFDYGTNGDAPTYYKLVLNVETAANFVTSTFKSGKRTGCATYADIVQGPSCDDGGVNSGR